MHVCWLEADHEAGCPDWAFCAPIGQWACSKLRPRPGQRLAVHERLHPAGGLRLRRSFSRSLGYSRLK
jgi:hypothetical protein